MNAKPRVLVIDDDLSVRILIRAALGGAGFEVTDCPSAESGIDSYSLERPDAVLMDVVMPGMDGYAACRAIRSLPGGASLPIVMMTGLDDIDSIQSAYEAGATDFTTKPINGLLLPYRLRYLIRAATDARHARENADRLTQAQRLALLAQWEYRPTEGRFSWSAEAADVLGIPFSAEDSIEQLLNWVHVDDQPRVRRVLESESTEEIEYRIVVDGIERNIHQSVNRSTDPASGKPRLVGAVQDVTRRRQAERRAAQLAYHDSLTGLPNRALLNDYVEQVIDGARRQSKRVALLAVDLDMFKRVNDIHGHAAGDALLVEAADRLTRCLRTGDQTFRMSDDSDHGFELGESLAARLGGDEFVVILPNICSAEEAAIVAQRLVGALGSPYRLGGADMFVSASVGISVFPDHGGTSDEIFRAADAALYQAKRQGRNNFQFFTERMHHEYRRRSSIEQGLRAGLARIEEASASGVVRETDLDSGFCLHFQPKLSLPGRRVAGLEALTRWSSPELGTVPPSEFIPVAEDSGLIVSLGNWVLRETCATVRRWMTEGYALPVAVNISSHQFRDPGFAKLVAGVLESSGVPASLIELELTEGTVMEDTVQSQRVLENLKRLGVRVAIDDFGTGYSSLSYLTRFPIDTLKIDRSFVNLIGEERNDAIISAIVALSRSLGLHLVAEGVEEQGQLDFLSAFEPLDIQGYYFAHPMDIPTVGRWLSEYTGTAAKVA